MNEHECEKNMGLATLTNKTFMWNLTVIFCEIICCDVYGTMCLIQDQDDINLAGAEDV